MRTADEILAGFWARTQITPGCWEWTGGKTPEGYGMLVPQSGKNNVGAHRFAYELLVGPIPEGLHLDHLCKNTSCVWPNHLEPVTVRENTLRGDGPSAVNAAKTHCVHGHPLDESNTYIYGSSRYCKTCRRQRTKAWRERESA